MKRLCFTAILLLFYIGPVAARIDILACEPEWKSLAEEIGGEFVKAYSATTAFQDPHHIEAKPSLIAKVRNADLVFCTGAELEVGWLPLLLRQSGNDKIQVGKPGYLMASDHVEKIEVPTQLDRSEGDIHAAGNPHVHLDPNNLLIIARELAQRLQSIDIDHQAQYQQNLSTFEQRWQKAIQEWERQAATLKNKKVVIHHRNLNYFFHWLGIHPVADLEPKPGLPPTSAHLGQLLTVIKQNRPDYIVLGAYQNPKGAQWLSKRSQLSIITLPYTVGGNKASTDLFSLFNSSIQLLLDADRG